MFTDKSLAANFPVEAKRPTVKPMTHGLAEPVMRAVWLVNMLENQRWIHCASYSFCETGVCFPPNARVRQQMWVHYVRAENVLPQSLEAAPVVNDFTENHF
jgi:hypothetical protein